MNDRYHVTDIRDGFAWGHNRKLCDCSGGKIFCSAEEKKITDWLERCPPTFEAGGVYELADNGALVEVDR